MQRTPFRVFAAPRERVTGAPGRSASGVVRHGTPRRAIATRGLGHRKVLAWILAVCVVIAGLVLPMPPASSLAPPPLPQSSTDKTFPAGSYIIDTGWMGTSTTFQPKPEGLQAYGLLYQLLVTEKIPVYWIIANGKTGQVQNAPNLTNTSPDLSNVNVYTPYTSTSPTTKTYYSGPFVIPAEFMTNAKLTSILTTVGLTGVRVDRAAADFTAPVYDKVIYWPKAILDSQNGDIAVGFYANAKVPATVRAYSFKPPSELNGCDDIFVMPHADPTWLTHNNLLPWNDQGGYIWAGCHAASVLENIDSPDTDVYPNMNFLSTEGLLLFGSHGDGSVPYFYGENLNVLPWTSLTAPGTGTPGTTTADRSDPVMQFIGATETAHLNGSEQVYMPNPETVYPGLTGTSRWNPGARFITWDPTQADVIAGKSPGVAAVDIYGRAFDDPSNGLVMYESGHSINKGSVGDTPAQRAYFNFLLLGGLERAPDVEINRANMPSTFLSGGTVPISATIDITKGRAPYTYTLESTCGGTFSPASGTTTTGVVSSTWTAPTVQTDTPCQVRVVVQDACNRQVFDAFGGTVKPVADLRITKTSSAAAVTTGSNVTYTLTVTNLGPASSGGVVVTDTLPASLSYVSASPSPASVSGQVVTWNLGTLASGASTTLTVTAKANQGGITVQNTATVSATTPDPNMANNTAYATTQVINSGISITKVARPEIVPAAGGPVTYEFVVRNVGDNPVSNVVVTDNPGCTISGPTGDLNGDSKLDPPYLGVDREIWRYTCTRTVTTATGDVTEPGMPALDSSDKTKQDVVTATGKDSAGNTLTAKASTVVTISTPAISVTKSLEPVTVMTGTPPVATQVLPNPGPGTFATFRVVVSNTGNVPLTGVDTTDIWEGTCDTATIPNLGVGQSISLLCTAKTPTSPTLTTVASNTFSEISYTVGTGWTGGWIDSQDASPTAGNIQVVAGTAPLDGSGGLPAGYSTPNVLSYAGNKQTLARQVDLSGAVSASVKFLYQRSNEFNKDTRNLNVYASADGTNWTPLASITPTGSNTDDTTWATYEAAIPVNLLGSGTRIRFGDTTVDLSGKWIHIDNVEILKGTVVNSVTAKGYGPFGTEVSATATAPVMPGTPSLAITKEASTAGPLANNDTFTYTVTVTNTGTVTQTGLVVSDTLPAGISPNGTVTASKPAYTRLVTDDFGTGTEAYNTGSGWATSWTESETTSPTAGVIQIATGKGNPLNSLYFKPDEKATYTIQRTVDLSGLTSASFAFDCTRDVFTNDPDALKNDVLKVYVGSQLVQTIDSTTATTVCATDKSTWKTISNSINSAQLVSGAVVKFEITGNKEAWIDNVVISGTVPAATGVPAGDPPTLTSAGSPYILDPGKAVTFTIPVKVTGAPADGFQFSNVAQATSLQQTTPVSASVTTPYRLAPSFEIRKTAIETWVNGSGLVTYRVELKNTGNTTLTPTSVSDPNCAAPLVGPTGDLGTPPDDKLQMGEIWRYTCTRTVSTPSSPPDPDNVPNTATATMTDGTTSLTKTADANVKVIHPAINLAVTPETKTILTGGTVAYTYTLTNTGDIDITNPAVTAANCSPVVYSAGDADNDGILDVTETWTYTCTTAALTASQTNQAVTATGKDLIFASTVTSAKAVAVTVINPKIAVVKVARDNAIGGVTGDSIQVGYPNSVTYLYSVTNTGDVALKPVVGTDNKCSPVAQALGSNDLNVGDVNLNNQLDPAEVWQFTCTPPSGLGEDTTNTVQFDAQYSVGGLSGTTSASDTARVIVRKPGLRLTKSAEAEFVRLGGQVPYTYVVTNTGSTSFTTANLGALTDDKCSPVVASRWLVDRGNNQVLDPPIAPDPANPNDTGTPGDAREYTCTATITAGMVVNGTVTNTVTMAASTDQYGSSYTPMPSSAMVFVTNPGFTLTKTATTINQNNLPQTGTNIDGEAGKPVTYTFTMAHSITTAYGDNRDSLNALALTISDPRCDAGTLVYVSGDTIADSQLNPGETWVYKCTLASLPSGDPTVNTVTVVGTVVNRSLNPDGTPAAPNDGLGSITRTASATVTPFGRVVTVLKRGVHCDVGVPTCVSTFEGSAFMVYKSDPTVTPPPTGVALTNLGDGTFATPKIQLNADYWLVETKAPDGFQLLPQPIKFHLAQSGLTLDPATSSSLITANATAFTITVTDVPAAELPKVGGDGPWPFLGGGLALLLAAGLYLLKTSGPQPAPRRVAP